MKKIACIGNITYDFLAYTYCFPIENSRTDYSDLIIGYGGPAANAATVIDRFGHNVDLYGILGKDIFSEYINKELSFTNINKKILYKDFYQPPLSYIIISEMNNTRTINSYRLTNENDTSFNNYETDYDIILTDGKYPKATNELFCKNKNAIKIIDAGRCTDNIIELCKKTDYLICSEDFANEFMQKIHINTRIKCEDENSLKIVLYSLNKYFKNSKIVITLGKNGYAYLDEDNNISKKSAINIGRVEDTNAAGDIFHGAFVSALANDLSFEKSLEFANITSSLSVTTRGGKNSCPSLNEVKKLEKKLK